MITFKTVLGPNKGKAKSRIWIEGARLIAAGFTVGAKYDRVLFESSLCLTLNATGRFKVSRKGEKPIIDITGATVTERFKGEHVTVIYKPGSIEIV